MDCKDVQGEIPSLIYEELDGDSAKTLRAHIEACPECRRVFEEHEATLAQLNQWPEVNVPLEPSAFLERAACASERDAYRNPWFLRPLPVAAAAALIIAVMLALTGVEVRRTDGGLVITLGRPAAGETLVPAGRGLELQEMIRTELDQNLEPFLEAMALRLDSIARDQEKKQFFLARAFHQQREEDQQFTQNLIRRVALESAAELERNRLLLEGLAGLIGDTERGYSMDGDMPIQRF